MIMRRVLTSICLWVGLLYAAVAQQVMIDHGVKAGDLWVFPLVTNQKEYLYLPLEGRLGSNPTGGPEFSFLRYVENKKGADGGSITEASGGGVLHFLAEYNTPADKVAEAQRLLRQKLKDEEVKIRGPVIFSGGKYTIVSSLARIQNKDGEVSVITGNAPVLEGNKIAISVKLDKKEAQILYNSLQQATPDLSVFFELQFQGVTDAYDATVTVNWSEVQKDEAFRGGVKVYIVGAEIDAAFKRLTRNNAIKLVSRGESASTEALLNNVYTKLLDLMFRRVEDDPPPRQEMGIGDALSSLLGGGSSGSGGGSVFPISLSFGYRMKDIQSSGLTVLNFNHAAAIQRTSMLAFNVGPLFKKYGNNPAYFRSVNLSDPIYSQREVEVSVDGSVAQDFEKYINSVSVTVRKQHGNGETTLGEVIVDKDSFAKNANKYTVLYGNLGDEDREKWLNFEYKIKWSFRDGGSYQTDWVKTNDAFVNVVPPYERREVRLEGDLAKLRDSGVRYALVKMTYAFFGKNKTEQILVRTSDTTPPSSFVLIQPKGDYKYTYEIRFRKTDGKDLAKPPVADDSGVILFDEMPGTDL